MTLPFKTCNLPGSLLFGSPDSHLKAGLGLLFFVNFQGNNEVLLGKLVSDAIFHCVCVDQGVMVGLIERRPMKPWNRFISSSSPQVNKKNRFPT